MPEDSEDSASAAPTVSSAAPLGIATEADASGMAENVSRPRCNAAAVSGARLVSVDVVATVASTGAVRTTTACHGGAVTVFAFVGLTEPSLAMVAPVASTAGGALDSSDSFGGSLSAGAAPVSSDGTSALAGGGVVSDGCGGVGVGSTGWGGAGLGSTGWGGAGVGFAGGGGAVVLSAAFGGEGVSSGSSPTIDL